jgi:Ca-activated chloride channel homolog
MRFSGSRHAVLRPLSLVLLTGMCGVHAISQDGPVVNIVPRIHPERSSPTQESNYRSDVKMVLVPASVMDRGDRPVLDLHKEDFHLFQDTVEQTIEVLSMDQAPISVGIVFDASGSMNNKLDKSFKAVNQFFLIQFNDAPEFRVPFTQDQDEIMSNLTLIRPQGWTAMLDAISLAVHKMKSAKNSRKVLLILSDGGDNNSRYSEGEVIGLLREADVQVYAIGLLDDPRFLKKATEATGGSMVVVHNTNDLPAAIDKLNSELRSQYVIGYYPTHGQNDGKFHNLKVQVLQKVGEGLHLSWRRGFYSPN